MNILVEGIDRAGKSTLVKELKNRLDWDARFLGHRSGNQYRRYLHEYAALDCTVIERGHISEAIYAELFGRPRPFSAEQLGVLDGIVRTTCLVVFADPDIRDVSSRYQERTLQQTVSEEEICRGQEAFQSWFARHDYQQRVYHSTDWDELARLVEALSTRINRVA